MVTIHTGDVLAGLAKIESGTVQTCVTSPPYWGLRDYGTARWEGGDAACDHKDDAALAERLRQKKSMIRAGERADGSTRTRIHDEEIGKTVQYRTACGKCGAVRVDSQIGLEPSPDAYVARMVEVFREVRRCLRDDGTLWLNLGDSYAGGGRGSYCDDGSKQSTNAGSTAEVSKAKHLRCPDGIKPKDLCMIPWRVALALQSDGWWLRSVIVWAKKSPMPESVTDRPTSSWEPIFLLAKSERYYYDAEAVKEQTQDKEYASVGKIRPTADGGIGFEIRSGLHKQEGGRPTRNQRNVWHLGPEPYAEAHFATFPTEIPRRCIMAGSKPGDLVLDPFLGSGTTLAVAAQLDRRGVGCELNPEYVKLAQDRIGRATRPNTYQSDKVVDSPLFGGAT